MATLLYNGDFGTDDWVEALQTQLPDETIYVYPDVPDKRAVEFAAVWNLPPGELINYPNLRAILLLGAGGDFLMKEKTLPAVPIVRLVDPTVVFDMTQYCLYWVAHFYRHFDSYAAQKSDKVWQRIAYPPIDQFKVGILGLGAIGTQIGRALHRTGYTVSAWVQSHREVEQLKLYTGAEGFAPFMAELDVLINVLPLTKETHSFLDLERLSLLPSKARVINISRGAVIDERALQTLLNAEKLAGAALDVFDTEPLPLDHWAWQHPKVDITPHASGQTYPRSAVKSLVANIQRIRNGELPFPIFDPTKGY
ncbi:MAG: glyoxylate/hydroxypyruvate reductase A [Oceanospirillaceae bacterium]|nr:glyoxylate/hydroxypyruvate reductase A [Oceanospirillaceae bacterium]